MSVSDELKGRRVLVTGAAGFIGSHLVERLAEEGANVRCFVRYTSRNARGMLDELDRSLSSRLEVVNGDVRDVDAVSDAMQDCEVVFHLAASISIPYSYVHPREVFETNAGGTFNVLQAARVHRPRRVVHVSTSEVYGSARSLPMSEDHPLQGQSPYSASKIAADKIAESFFKSFEVPVVTIRPFNTFGPRQSARAVIPTIVTQALGGNEIRLGSLEPKRDFTYVTDTVSGIIAGAAAAVPSGLEVNLGTGTNTTIGDLVGTILRLTGTSPAVRRDSARVRPEKSEVDELLSDPRLASKILGWTARISLEEGLRRTIEWIRAHRDHPAMQEGV